MGRLIDADALIETLQNEPNYSIELPAYMGDAIRKLVNTHHAMVIDVIKKQPTAYDVEKVVAELEEEKYTREEKFKYNARTQAKMCSYNIGLNKAIQIVKDGGSDE